MQRQRLVEPGMSAGYASFVNDANIVGRPTQQAEALPLLTLSKKSSIACRSDSHQRPRVGKAFTGTPTLACREGPT